MRNPHHERQFLGDIQKRCLLHTKTRNNGNTTENNRVLFICSTRTRIRCTSRSQLVNSGLHMAATTIQTLRHSHSQIWIHCLMNPSRKANSTIWTWLETSVRYAACIHLQVVGIKWRQSYATTFLHKRTQKLVP
jgi:hypothetical protein